MSDNNEKVMQSISPKKLIPIQLILGHMSIALALCDPLVIGSTLGSASMPQDDEEQSVKKKDRVSIQKCMICKKMGEEICNRACNLHRDEVQLKHNLQRSTSHQKMFGLGIDWLRFKVRYNSQYNKVSSYFLDIMIPSSCVQGEFFAPYYSLKNHGVAYVKKFQSIPTKKYKQLKKMVYLFNWKYQRLFTNFQQM